VAATNRIPEEAVAEGKLREDLLYRLNVFPITLPPLRERGEDLLLLAGSFLSALNRETASAKKLSSGAIERLLGYSWPGNVRELKNVIHRSYIMAKDEILPEHLFDEQQKKMEATGPNLILKVGCSLQEAEERLIKATLAHLGGNKKKAAEILGISLRTLYYRLNEHHGEGAERGEEASTEHA
jgi:DNA-binding NtrC family response regulator